MTDTPREPDPVENISAATARLFAALGRYFGAYMLGIVVCVLITPAELTLAGVQIWMFYPFFALPAFFGFYIVLGTSYQPFGGVGLAFWAMYAVGFIPVILGIYAFVSKATWLTPWRPLWIGFPIGFVGTLGVYYIGASGV